MLNQDKLKQIEQWTNDHHYDFTYISDPKNIEYLTGYYTDPHERIFALIVFPDHDPLIFAPQLEVEDIQKSGWSFDVDGYLDHQNPWRMIAKDVEQRVHEPHHAALEKSSMQFPVHNFEALAGALSHVTFDGDVSNLLEQMRLIKTPEELKELAAAGKEADFAMRTGWHSVKPGVSETKIAADLQYALMKRGVMEMSFGTLVQAGKHASEPHSVAGNNKVGNDELVLFDLGTMHNGYASDTSRTVAVGHPDDKKLDIYKTVQAAQLKAMDFCKPGITAEELDHCARKVIDDAGYGKYFIHRLGHGIGLGTHEYPSIMQGNKMVLKPGMCFSIEPGIYVPGVAGVRIEDCVHVTENGCEPFTHNTKDLTYVDK
ncbi:M24 family metallopeptidase [Philodulcilactobacillus myokoensis]|uniref:M24 family metallopeptidase n=1 Tax=Philodulcilactobacillus myokoensis TaxID=2929573 RepID=UPI002570F562|nr:Xaa-Pro peptidase family protein [Philodulcilactobacillus myokoensis]